MLNVNRSHKTETNTQESHGYEIYFRQWAFPIQLPPSPQTLIAQMAIQTTFGAILQKTTQVRDISLSNPSHVWQQHCSLPEIWQPALSVSNTRNYSLLENPLIRQQNKINFPYLIALNFCSSSYFQVVMSLLSLYNLVECYPQPASCACEVSEYYFSQSTCTRYYTSEM